MLTRRIFSVTHRIYFHFLKRIKLRNIPVCDGLASKTGDFWEELPVIDPPLVKKKRFFLVVPPVGNVDIALFFTVGEVSGYSA